MQPRRQTNQYRNRRLIVTKLELKETVQQIPVKFSNLLGHNLKEIDDVLNAYVFSKLKQDWINNLNRCIITNDTEITPEKSPSQKKSNPRWSHRRILPEA